MENTCSGYAATMHDPGSSERQAVTAEKDTSAYHCGYLCVPLRLNKTSLAAEIPSLAEGCLPSRKELRGMFPKKSRKNKGC